MYDSLWVSTQLHVVLGLGVALCPLPNKFLFTADFLRSKQAMLVRLVCKFACPLAAAVSTSVVSLNRPQPNYFSYKQRRLYFSSTKKKEEGSSESSSSSQSDSDDISSDEEEEEEKKAAEANMNEINPLTPKRADQIQQQEEELPIEEPIAPLSESATQPLTIQTSYGRMRFINPMLNQNKLEALTTIHYINDQSSINYVKSLLKKHPNGLVVFDPSTHYVNMFALFNGVKRRIIKDFYGTARQPKNPFKNCKTNKEVFDLHRRILIQQKNILARFCLIVDHQGELRLKGDTHEGVPSSFTLKEKIRALKESDGQGSYYKHDYIVPTTYWLGLNTSDQWEKKGISIDMLDKKKIYPNYSVWPPTSQQYLSLFGEYVEKNKKFLRSLKTTLDIGCGTGVLSFVLHRKCGGISDIFALDSNKQAVECTKINAQILNLQESLNVTHVDFVQAIAKNKIDTALTNAK